MVAVLDPAIEFKPVNARRQRQLELARWADQLAFRLNTPTCCNQIFRYLGHPLGWQLKCSWIEARILGLAKTQLE